MKLKIIFLLFILISYVNASGKIPVLTLSEKGVYRGYNDYQIIEKENKIPLINLVSIMIIFCMGLLFITLFFKNYTIKSMDILYKKLIQK